MTEKLFHNQINEQISSAYRNGTDVDPTVLVKRSDGRITVGRLDRDAQVVGFTEKDQALVKPVSLEALSDDRQAQLAEELAGVALRGGEVDVATAAEALAESKDTSIEPSAETFHDKFWAKHTELVERIDRAIATAGHIDPSMQANGIARDIESIRQLEGLSAETADYLKSVIDLCHEVSRGGRDRHSEYHRNAGSGLQKISGMIRAIK